MNHARNEEKSKVAASALPLCKLTLAPLDGRMTAARSARNDLKSLAKNGVFIAAAKLTRVTSARVIVRLMSSGLLYSLK
jgi:hypothetical protein